LKKVSVIIPTRNRGQLLREAVDSVALQDYPSIEIVIVDDASDEPVEIQLTENVKNCELVVIRNEQPRGGGYSRHRGALASTGGYVCFLDDDDFYLPDKLKLLVDFLEKHACFDAVFAPVERTSIGGAKIWRNIPAGEFRPIRSLDAIPFLHTNGSLVRRAVFDSVSFYPELQKFQDTQFHLELVSFKKVCFYHSSPVAVWRDKHSLPQITDMDSEAMVKRSIENFERLRAYFASKQVLTGKLRWFVFTRLLRMYAKNIGVSSVSHPYHLLKWPHYLAYWLLCLVYFRLRRG
jgi:glycosyltransferase involved in cell wall biosynthesis